MKLVTAIVKPFKLGEVRDALHALRVTGMTVSDVGGLGRQGGHTETYRGAEYRMDLVPKARVEVIVTDDLAQQVVATIAAIAATGKIGDGKIWITEIDEIVRVRTGERDADAI